MIGRLKLYGIAIGTFLLAVLAGITRMQTLKNQRDKARQQRDVAKARVHIASVEKKIEKKKRLSLLSKEERIKEKVEKNELKDLDNLTDSNNF
jgi:cell division protein FtsL